MLKTNIMVSKEGIPASLEFGDLYFSREGGLEEAKYIFLEGNNLETRFANNNYFQIVELGFGTGLNFLATLNLWESHYRPGKRLVYYGIEKFPLTSHQISQVLSQWSELKLQIFLEKYSFEANAITIIEFIELEVELIIIFKDVLEAFTHLPNSTDVWFLDGFAPSKNPEMWVQTIFNKMAGSSSIDVTFATFTAASSVRRGLEQAGFKVIKRRGFGKKREMLIGNL